MICITNDITKKMRDITTSITVRTETALSSVSRDSGISVSYRQNGGDNCYIVTR